MKFFRQLNFLLSPAHKRQVVILTFLLIIGMVFETAGIGILVPALSFLLDTGTSVTPSPYVSFLTGIFGPLSKNAVILTGLSALILFYILKSIFLIYSSYRQSRFSAALSVDLSHDLMSGYLRMPYMFHLNRNSSELQRNIQLEILYFGGISLAATTLATEVTTIVGISALLIYIEPVGALSVVIFFGFFAYLFNRKTNQHIAHWGFKRQELDGEANKHLLEALGGVKQVKLSHLEHFFLARFTGSNKGKAVINTKIQVVNSIPRLYLELLAVVGMSLIVVVMMVQSKPLVQLIPVLGIFAAAAFRLIPSVNKIITSIQTINFAESVLNVLTKEFTLIRQISPPAEQNLPLTFTEKLEIKELDFSYDGAERKSLNNINISIQKGDFIGFVGSTGSGKSTLIDVITGLLIPQQGGVFVDGVNINSHIIQWQNMIGYVPQFIYLTDDTLRRNIAFGIPDDKIDDEKVSRALNTAQLSAFIKRLPEGLETVVGERGVRLSGGERQRIGIARALYHDPPVLILDEATSSLDNATESEFMESVNALQGIKTMLIVAHRLTTVEKCDRIYELNNGVVITSN